MKRKSNQPHVRYEARMDSLNTEEIVALLEARLIDEISGSRHLSRKSDETLDTTTEISPVEGAFVDHRKRMKSVSSTESGHDEDVRHSHDRHSIGNKLMEHKHHTDHTVGELRGLSSSAHGIVQAST